jgi:hypothetical protein
MLLFLNWQLDAISWTDPSVLRTVGTWSEFTGSNAFGKRTYFGYIFANYKILNFNYRQLLYRRVLDENGRALRRHRQFLPNA